MNETNKRKDSDTIKQILYNNDCDTIILNKITRTYRRNDEANSRFSEILRSRLKLFEFLVYKLPILRP